MRLPDFVESFLRAVQNGDHARLSQMLGDDGNLTANDDVHRGGSIHAWLDREIARGTRSAIPIQKRIRKGHVVVTVLSDEVSAQGEEIEHRSRWTFALDGERIAGVVIEPDPAPMLPPVVGAYVRATNRSDLDALVATFDPQGLVNDQLQEHRGHDRIRQWATRDVIGERLTMYVVEAIDQKDAVVVKANVDGDFDRRGLPDPLLLAFYFTVRDGKIIQLIILRNEPT